MGYGPSVSRIAGESERSRDGAERTWTIFPAREEQRPDERPSKHSDRPASVQLIRLPENISGAHCCSVLLALHAAAVSQNLRCVLSSVDPEGPHQLRVALRRLRVVLRTFRPVMRDDRLAQLQVSAREIGSIVGDLRDADVMIDEVIRPAAAGDTRLMAALDAWRQEVRGRVRARLLAAGAPAFASDLATSAGTFEWRKKGGKAKDEPAAELIDAFLERSWERVAPTVSRMCDLSPVEIHGLRKDVKALRYAAEFADAVSQNDNGVARSLKRVQDALGYVNDWFTLQRFDPALLTEKDAFVRVRDRLVLDRRDPVAASLATAQALLREIAGARPQASAGWLVGQIA